MESSIIDISQETVQKLKKFRFAKLKEKPHFYIIKVDKKSRAIQLEEYFENGDFEDVVEELPDDSPRYIIVSTKVNLNDGRTVFPLATVYYLPETTSTEQRVSYASGLRILQSKADLDKTYNLTEKEDFTSKWLAKQLERDYK